MSTTITRAPGGARLFDHRYGSGRDLHDPAVEQALRRSWMRPQPADELAAAEAAYMLRFIPRPPAEAKLARHVRLYGEDQVRETMALYWSDALPLSAYATTAPEGRRMTPELRELIRHLAARGFVLGAIAKTLNLKEKRLRKILREPVSARGGGSD